jgi:glycosyltransferase involved in cell wall biosynthesis
LSEVAVEVANLDVFLFPMETGANTRSSTLPVALGSGVPVVAVKASETDESLFRHTENVFFARDLTATAFAEAALRLVRDPGLRSQLVSGSRQLYESHLSWPRIADQLLAEA